MKAMPSPIESIITNSTLDHSLKEYEQQHERDALTTLWLNCTIIGCLLLAYYVKSYRIYCLPESAGTLLVGLVMGGIARLSSFEILPLLEFSPEVFFFVLLPPIIFEAGYSLNRKDFFDNVGAITLYAVAGTIISCLVVGLLLFRAAQAGLIPPGVVDSENPMEALLFGALIAAIDPVATLSIMGSAELQCDPLLYSLVFGESVVNDAISISLFNVFAKYYNSPKGPSFSTSQIPHALMTFFLVSGTSVVLGVALGMVPSFLRQHTTLADHPRLEASLLFIFCYLCYSLAEAMGLSGVMALFFQGIVLSHYTNNNSSSSSNVLPPHTSQVTSGQIFATMATFAETAVFLYMGMAVFTGRFQHFDITFSVVALALCLLGRFLNIFLLSWIANLWRDVKNRITFPTQCVLWFAGLRGAIAFALALNMPGSHRDYYATATLFICIFTTVVCGGLTNRVLTMFDMKQRDKVEPSYNGNNNVTGSEQSSLVNSDDSRMDSYSACLA